MISSKTFDDYMLKYNNTSFTSAIIKDNESNEVKYYHKKQENKNKSSIIKYMKLLPDNIHIILYHSPTKTYMVYDDKRGWLDKMDNCNLFLFNYFNHFIECKHRGVDELFNTIFGDVITLYNLVMSLELIDKTLPGNTKIKISYMETNNYIYNRYLSNEIITIDDMKTMFVKDGIKRKLENHTSITIV